MIRRCVLPGDLNCHQERPKREDDELKGKRDDRVKHHLGPSDAWCEPLPGEPGVECVRQHPSHLLKRDRDKRDDPQGDRR